MGLVPPTRLIRGFCKQLRQVERAPIAAGIRDQSPARELTLLSVDL